MTSLIAKQDVRHTASILVVDDDESLRTVVVRTLTGKGYSVWEADGAAQGLELACHHLPDLVISDVQLGDGDGYSILAELRQRPETAAIPFILMTGGAGPEGMRRGMELGADDYLPKPFSVATLLAAVNARLWKQQALRQQEEQTQSRLVAILEATTDLVSMTDPSMTHVQYLNHAGRRLLGVPAGSDLPTVSLRQFHPPHILDVIERIGIPAATQHGSWTGETVFRSADGGEFTASQVILAHKGAAGTVDYLSVIARDISTAKQAEAALRRSEEVFRLIAEHSADLIAMVTAAGEHLYISPSYRRALGCGLEEINALPPLSYVHPEDRTRLLTALGEMQTTGAATVIEYRVRAERGDWLDLEAHNGAIRNAQGQIEGILIAARDVTRRKQAERERAMMEIQLRHAQKLESIGQLAAGIAHEINTPTQYIGDNTRFLQDSFKDLDELGRMFMRLLDAVKAGLPTNQIVQQIEDTMHEKDAAYLAEEIPVAIQHNLEGLERVTRIVRAMKDFSHPGSEEKTPIDLNQAIGSTLTVSRNEWKYHAELVTRFDPQLPLVPCLPGEFNQVILNLIINAAHAIADVVGDGSHGKGTLSVSTRQEGGWVEIRIQDTGPGIPEHVRSRIFDPFFTTKPVGKGTGQGLAMARSVVVDKHGGTIRFESVAGGGTTFIVCLPLAGAPRRGES